MKFQASVNRRNLYGEDEEKGRQLSGIPELQYGGNTTALLPSLDLACPRECSTPDGHGEAGERGFFM